MELPEIKSRLSLKHVLDYYGLKPDRHLRLNCPFHQDKTPSLQVYWKTHTCYCFSSNCPTHGRSMDVIDFIMHKENLDKHGAILKAKELIGGTAKAIQPLTRAAILSKMFISFKNAVHSSKPAQEYLQQRHLDYRKTEVGYNGGQFHHGARKQQALIESCVKVGLLKELGYKGRGGDMAYRAFGRGCVVFPLKDREGHIVSLYFRSTQNDTDQRHFYLKDRQGLYPKYPPAEAQQLILTESVIDAATVSAEVLTKADYKSYQVLALYGTNGLTEEHRKAIKALENLEELIFFFDGDDAGAAGVKHYGDLLHREYPNLKLSQVNTPEGEDVNSLLNGHEPEILTHLLNERSTLFLLPTPGLRQAGSNEKETQLKEKVAEPVAASTPSPEPRPGKLDTRNVELLLYTTETLKLTVLGGIRISGLDRLKVTLKIQKPDSPQIVRHSLDLYHGRQVEQLVEMISGQLELSSSKAARVLGDLTTALEEYRHGRLEAMKPKTAGKYQMNEQERKAALEYLKNPDLMQQTLKDISGSGIVGEENNAMTGFVVNLSRKREKPLHVMYLGASGSGKTHLQEGLSLLVPEEDRLEATGLSDQSLYYEGVKLKGKILFIEDLDGAENVMYIIRELQSKGRITKRVAWRDNKGNTQTVEVVARGPVVISSCTTRERLYEDNANRCILLHIDQGRLQDKRVMDYMKAKSTGKVIETEQQKRRKLLQNAQRLLREVKVYNPYADLIELPETVFKPRRSLPLLLGFIETVTFYHQYQRRVKTAEGGEQYIESTVEDIAKSFALLKDVLFAKSDELSRASRDFLERLKKEVRAGDTFYTKEIRKRFRIPYASLKRYVSELQGYGYVKVKGGNRYRGYEYMIVDYGEYDKLRQGIDDRLEAILLKIKKVSGSVAQSGSQGQMSHLAIA